MITASIVHAEQRINFLPSITKTYIHFEQAIYYFFNMFCKEYSGAYWEYVQLSNGGKFMFPRMADQVRLINTNNHADVTLSNKAAGICITLVALSHYSMSAYNHGDEGEVERLATQYHLLLEYVCQHEEANLIDKIID